MNALDSINLEGDETPHRASTLLARPELQYIGSNQRYAEMIGAE